MTNKNNQNKKGSTKFELSEQMEINVLTQNQQMGLGGKMHLKRPVTLRL